MSTLGNQSWPWPSFSTEMVGGAYVPERACETSGDRRRSEIYERL